MRPILLTALALVVTTTLHAQMYEAGIGYGTGSSGTPQGIPSEYQGSNKTSNPVYMGMLVYNINDFWQIGGSIDAGTWIRTGNYASIGGGTTPVTITVANVASSFCVRFNRLLPFYSAVNPELIKSYLYLGASGGLLFTSNDGKQSVAPDGHANFDYQNGKGYTVGFQVGYTYFFRKHLGLYAELAPRYASVHTSDAFDAHKLENFNLTYYNFTIGVRYRFKYYY